MKILYWVIVALIVLSACLYGWAYSGAYDIGADEPHWKLTAGVLDTLRDRSVETRSARLDVPDLDDPQRVALGARHYSEMCAGCHLAPGNAESEIRQGLYPVPPDLTRMSPPPAEAFWVIKHGIKMSAMPAWGKTHDDQEIWAIVAFLQKLPHLDNASYRSFTQTAHAAEGHAAGHGSEGEESAHESSHPH